MTLKVLILLLITFQSVVFAQTPRRAVTFQATPGSSSLGSNAEISGCESLRPEGHKTFAQDLSIAYNQGFKCLDHIYRTGSGSTDPNVIRRAQSIRQVSTKLLENFSPGANDVFKFKCNQPIPAGEGRSDVENVIGPSSYAVAITLHGPFKRYSMAPGIQFSMPYLNEIVPRERQSLIFHELLHHGEIDHSRDRDVYDTVFALELCCFGNPSSRFNPPGLPSTRDMDESNDCRTVLSRDHGGPR